MRKVRVCVGVLVICLRVFTMFCIVSFTYIYSYLFFNAFGVCMCGFVMCGCVYVWIL